MTGQVEELSALVGDLVEIDRERPAEVEDVRLDEVVEHAVARAKVRAPKVLFRTQLEESLVRGAPAQLERAVSNLLDNAAKWSSSVDVDVSGTEVTVRDHGPGISEEDLPYVFDRFYRATNARNLPGSGLGLAIVRHVAQTHGGEATAENAPDGGAVFHFTLPAPSLPDAAVNVSGRWPTTVTMDKIVSLCRRRGFVFPSSEIYGGLGSTFDYGHYGVLRQEQHPGPLARGDGAGARRHRADRLGDHPPPAGLGGVGPRRGLHRPARRLPHLQAPLPRRQARGLAVRQEAVEAARRVLRVRPDRGAAVQPDVRDDRRPGGRGRAPARSCGRRRRRASSSTSRTSSSWRGGGRRSGSRRSASRSATRSRPGNFLFRVREFEQMEMEYFVPPAEADQWYRYWIDARFEWYVEVRAAAVAAARAGARAGGALALLPGDERHRVRLPDRLVGARGRRQPR